MRGQSGWMVRLALLSLVVATGAANAQSDTEDVAHRADRLRTEALNRQALQASGPHTPADSRRRYQKAREQYDRDIAAWRRQVAACNAGDWSACR